MRLIVTTRGRVRTQRTLMNLPESLADQVELWVQRSDAEIYNTYWLGVNVLPDWVTNLGQTRQWLVRHYWGEKIVLMDDDLDWYYRRDPADWHLTCPPPTALEQMFREIDEALDTYAHVGVSGREGNNRVMDYAVDNTRYMRLLAYNSAVWPDHIQCDRLDGMSDLDTNLQLMRAGLPCRVFYRWGQGQRSTQSPGGCSVYRTHDTHAAEVAALAELHPGLVTPRYKRNVSGGLFGHRDEVTIAWHMALGWDARIGRVDSPLERLSRELASERAECRRLEAANADLAAALVAKNAEEALRRERSDHTASKRRERRVAARDADSADRGGAGDQPSG